MRAEEACKTYRELYEEGRRILEQAGLPDAALDARFLLEEVCGTNLQTLLVFPEKKVTEEEVNQYRAFIQRRKDREPTAMILGEWDFMGLTFRLNKSTLIPEQDTEVLVETALEELKRRGLGEAPLRILDLCTGSGCILLSLLHELRNAGGLGTDLSEEALEAARENAVRLGLQERAAFRQGDLWEPVGDERFDLIVSNPPYVPTEVIPTLEPEVRCGEPYAALDGGEDGLVFYRRIMREAAGHLKPSGIIIVESGFDEAPQIAARMQDQKLRGIRTVKDYGGLDRVVLGAL
ncbi:MAG: peptide chain release factor N(5)-glutamine methyltransferase [Lachnospiraceae bacterium]|nr:peptide chain release factor N(5)-glutamine methyltransferase [Bacillota bacterium]MCI6595452.1 peptide chain release factor N(5)-glutamine methyltransferase [Bacillota bacterium]MDD7252301.1 peptide chain release factor N(5)-glutamine methyltransferase [Bacillota bacterium]MDY2948847.1 peptide chain release factor N(5)-glutamine methyltransferase [Lachnospiraceae bacterium]